MSEMQRDGKPAKTRATALTLLFQIFAFGQRKPRAAGQPLHPRQPPPGRAERRHPLPGPGRGRGAAAYGRPAGQAIRPYRARDVPDGGDDRHAPGRAVRAALARRRLDAAVRVRRNYVRGEFGTPKSKRSSRSVPLATGRHGARAALPDSAVPGRRRPRVRAPRDRQADRRRSCSSASRRR